MNAFTFLISSFGYVGIFIVSLLSSSSIFLPIPGFASVFITGAALNPLAVSACAAAGSAIGELTGYAAGKVGERLLKNQWLERLKALKLRYGLIIFLFALLPLPFDVVGIFCGAISYNLKKFLIYTFVGKLLKYAAIAYAGYYTASWLLAI